MSLSIQEYFNLGLDTTDEPINQAGLINTIRVAPIQVSNQHNRVIFRFENEGLLTRDSGIRVRAQGTSALSSNVCLNVVNGILGSVKRATVKIDGQNLVDLIQPNLIETNRMYSRNAPTKLIDFEKSLIGNDFRVITDSNQTDQVLVDDAAKVGQTFFGPKQNVIFTASQNKFIRNVRLSDTAADNKSYFIPLHMLGMNFLRHNNLPLYLMKERNIELILEFDNDNCLNWCFEGGAAQAITKSSVKVDLDSCELIQVNIMLDEELAESQKAMLKEQSATFTLIESYLVKNSFTSSTANVEAGYSPIRINAQNREVHKILAAWNEPAYSTQSDIVCNQQAISLGDVTHNWKINGVLLFDDDISQSSISYYLNSEYNNDNGLNVPRIAWICDQSTLDQDDNARASHFEWRGRWYYLGQSLRNGNQGVVGAGTAIRTPIDLNLTITPRIANDPKQSTTELVGNIYVSNTKILTIMENNIAINF